MTAEICILNRGGVALAADSAVTIGREANKIYTSADKLFQLSTDAPVGIMVYGNADFLGLPWETIIKDYRSKTNAEPFETVEQHARHFIEHLRKSKSLFPRKTQDDRAMELVALHFFAIREEMLRDQLNRKAEQEDGLDEADVGTVAELIVGQVLETITSRPRIDGFSSAVVSKLRTRLGPRITSVRKELFGGMPLKKGTLRALNSVAIELLSRRYFGPAKSGLVFAGFGREEYMPALVAYEIEEMVDDLPRCVCSRNLKVTDTDNIALIVPFAQKDMVHLFLEGISGSLKALIWESTELLFRGTITKLVEALAPSADPDVTLENFKEILESLYEEWEGEQEKFWKPVLDNVAALPKDELGAMAEALVNLTKFRRRVSADRETVGGPIDVAVVTKGDGFIWLRRKHYFEPGLNPRAMGRYHSMKG